jgi:hypothetical protein
LSGTFKAADNVTFFAWSKIVDKVVKTDTSNGVAEAQSLSGKLTTCDRK